MLRTTMFALTLATLAAGSALAGEQPPRVGQEGGADRAVTQVSQSGGGFQQVATLPTGTGNHDGR